MSSSDTSVSSDVIGEEEQTDYEGKVLGDYNIIKKIGHGSYSTVWLTYNTSDSKFYALKVQNPEDYSDGIEEIKVLNKLEKHKNILNLKEYFIKRRNDEKILCSAFDLHFGNLDGIIRKGNFKNGFPLDNVKKIFRQIVEGVHIIHNRCKLTHCDIKTDNILVKGVGESVIPIISEYRNLNFHEKYKILKNDYWVNKLQKNINNIKKMKKKDKYKLKKSLHKEFIGNIKLNLGEDKFYEKSNNYEEDIDDIEITIGDFGAACTEDEFYESEFGTRYYMSPEVILGGKINEKVDVWALGCILYELINGEFLFDPDKDKYKSRNYYHLLEMSKVSGKFDKKYLKSTKNWRNYFDSDGYLKDTEFKEYYDIDELLFKVTNIKERSLVKDLLLKTLILNPVNRISARDILDHEFLKNSELSENVS